MSDQPSRCTFAIISHPDAGKTTMTERLLWHGGVLRQAGKVKAKSGPSAKSDWMALEKQRGISVTTSVMSFDYRHRAMHLLDTPGHKDFSEDTYRTLTAVESVLMMIDSAKGVEAQTKKLMEVCRLRDTPIITFMNKFDRDAMEPFGLLENVEKICSIQTVPLSWPIGDGPEFRGIYSLVTKKITLFDEGATGEQAKAIHATGLEEGGGEDETVKQAIGQANLQRLREELAMIRELLPSYNEEEFLAGIQTPVFFGSALYNFGVQEVLAQIAQTAPGPASKKAKLPPFNASSEEREVKPEEDSFSGFIFKIQANMDKNHRDRIAFLRVCSGALHKGQKFFHARTEKEMKAANPLFFQARQRESLLQAVPGDIVGLYDTGKFQIGDTFTEGEKIQFTGIPSFAPEIFMKVELGEPLKAKQLDKGLAQLSEEGAVQLFQRPMGSEKILGAVGMLQFDVVKFRLEDEYHVKGLYSPMNLVGIRWIKFRSGTPEKRQKEFQSTYSPYILIDHKGRSCFAIRSEWDLKLVQEKNPEVEFYKNSDYR